MQTPVLDDLAAETAGLDTLVAGLEPDAWARPTPAEGWTIAHQIAHLAWTDARALLAVTDPDTFARETASAAARFGTYVDEGAEQGAWLPPGELLAQWRAGRARLWEVLAAQPPGSRFGWYGPPMSTASMATGRLMETWAHGEDIADTLGVRREPTARLWHVARIGVRARDFAFAVHGRPAPAEEFRVELTAPDGTLWTFGPADADQRVTGPALDFCLLAVRRRHRDDVAVRAEGPDADAWLSVAQAFAGPPGGSRSPSKGADR
ncbi:TIGR03084 family metal-binding protein [Streptomyces sp. NBC_01477]|uniref:TIGR03084 family metal-binding protein n=1 Tax=Streptomyces sp. NBC_01477 TaxID=2976015 RepID=UPI002E332F5D|nr:TIGR03084 family metal-binding protein [Streptomyces sp. NBC_01477]